jgi:hypothetical protein
MEVFKIQAEGRLKIGAEQIPVFILEDGRRAVNQSALYQYLTGKSGKGISARYSLTLSKLNKYLPAEMLETPEFAGSINDEVIRLFTAEELLLLCKGIVMASFKGHLSQTWQKAHPKAQLLLVEFATEGIQKVIDRAIQRNPLMTFKQFVGHMEMLLNFNTQTGQ